MTVPRAEGLAEVLVGRALRTYLWREVRIERVEDGVVVVRGHPRDEPAQVSLADVQAGLDQLHAEGQVQVSFAALGPWATYVAAILVEVEGAAYSAYGDIPAHITLARNPGGR